VKIELKFWQSGARLSAFAAIMAEEWSRLLDALENLVIMGDPERCPGPVLRLLAYQRGVDRLPGEDMELFRRRVKYASANALDAGSVGGFERIWERLGLGRVIQRERVDSAEWDVVEVEIEAGRFAPYRGLFEELVRLYGRTCRRYVLVSRAETVGVDLRPFDYHAVFDRFNARIEA